MDLNRTSSVIGAAAAGAAATYLLDAEHGRRRRALVRDKMVHTGHRVADASGVVARDMAHRTQGFIATSRSRMRHEDVSPERLEERARAALGRVVSHPSAIEVEATDKCLAVSGYILEREVEPLMVALRAVPGVTDVENRLEVGRNPEQMPSLQGGRRRPGIAPDVFQRRMAPATRVLVGAGSIGAILYGLGRRDVTGGVLSSFGLLASLRAATNLPFRRLFGMSPRGAVRIQNAIEVDAPIEEVYDFFSHFENFPRFMQHIRQVRRGEDGIWHWETDGPLGIGVSWDAVVTRMDGNRRISWRSVPGSEVGSAGTVWFERTNRGTTRVQIQMGYTPPAGAVGHAVASLLGADPVRQMDEDLVRFKSIIERGKTSAHGEEVTRDEVRPRGSLMPVMPQ